MFLLRYRNDPSSEIVLYEVEQKFLKGKNPDGHFSFLKELKAKKEKLAIKRSVQKDITIISWITQNDSAPSALMLTIFLELPEIDNKRRKSHKIYSKIRETG